MSRTIDPSMMNYKPKHLIPINTIDTTPVTIDTSFERYNIYKSYGIRFAVLKEHDKYKNRMVAYKFIVCSGEIITLGVRFGEFYWSDTAAYIYEPNGVYALEGLVKIKKWTSKLNFLSCLELINSDENADYSCGNRAGPSDQVSNSVSNNNNNTYKILQNKDLQRFICEYV